MLTIAGELFLNGGKLQFNVLFLPIMLWGYIQYRLCGVYRKKHGGGGPGLERPPERLVTRGPYFYTRNPMYLGHIIFLIGFSLALKSLIAALITVLTAIWFHLRVLDNEKYLLQHFGAAYLQYTTSVKRWIPGLF